MGLLSTQVKDLGKERSRRGVGSSGKESLTCSSEKSTTSSHQSETEREKLMGKCMGSRCFYLAPPMCVCRQVVVLGLESLSVRKMSN